MSKTGEWEQAVALIGSAGKSLDAAIKLMAADTKNNVPSAEDVVKYARASLLEAVDNEKQVYERMLKQQDEDERSAGLEQTAISFTQTGPRAGDGLPLEPETPAAPADEPPPVETEPAEVVGG